MSTSRPTTRALAVTAAAAAALALTAGTPAASAHGRPTGPVKTTIQLLSFNDFHGNLEAPGGSSGRVTTGYTETLKDGVYGPTATTVNAGGAEYLATHLKQA